jgi:hypothetical protein
VRHKFDRKLNDPESVREIIDKTIEEYASKGRPLTSAAFGAALGIHRDTVKRYAEGEYLPKLNEDGSNKEEVEAALAVCAEVYRAWLLCDRDLQDTLMEHGGNNGAMFLARAVQEYKDKQEFALSVQAPVFDGENELE